MTLDALLDDYLGHVRTERGYSTHTVAAYRGDLIDLIGFAATRPPALDREFTTQRSAACARSARFAHREGVARSR